MTSQSQVTPIILKMIEEQWIQARQAEEQRANMANYIIAVTTAVMGLLANTGLVQAATPLTLMLIVVGIYGLLVSMKLYERFSLHVHRVGKMMRQLDELFPEAHLRERQKLADDEHYKEFGLMGKIRLHGLWTLLYALISVAGVVTTIIAFGN